MNEIKIAQVVVQAAFDLPRELGPGFLESLDEILLADTLQQAGLSVERQKPIPIHFRGRTFDEGFRADLIINGIVLIELKSVSALARVHKKQVLTYLRLSDIRLGLLVNFGGELLKGNVERLVNNLPSSD